jgi:hypothetical protein
MNPLETYLKEYRYSRFRAVSSWRIKGETQGLFRAYRSIQDTVMYKAANPARFEDLR